MIQTTAQTAAPQSAAGAAVTNHTDRTDHTGHAPDADHGAAPGTFAALARDLAAAGFAPGAPEHIRPETRDADRAACRGLRCPLCNRRGLAYRPYHTTDGRYAVLAQCARCPGAEVV